ncbi:MAG TPA: AmmeMemoRadiSam system protein B [Pseudobacteroides sp.]|uniref:AmmeMemoRadiSam system protein B n=1 Tax=Pseudobacteroides sp. TaxID=1968840 RepID=UPI002F9544BF
MGSIISSYIFPHPPVIVPEVGMGEEKNAITTLQSCKKAAGEIKLDNPTTVIITTPHGPYFQDYLYLSTKSSLKGNFARFGRKDIGLEFKNNSQLLNKIIDCATKEGIDCGGLDNKTLCRYGLTDELDHGALVPLYFISKELQDFSLVHISIAGFTLDMLHKFGSCISSAVEESDERVVFVASGDLSHRVNDNSPYGSSPLGSQFDNLFVESIQASRFDSLLDIDNKLCEGAAECGLRSFVIMFGALEGSEIKPQVYSYEAPFGIGYCVAKFKS